MNLASASIMSLSVTLGSVMLLTSAGEPGGLNGSTLKRTDPESSIPS